MLYQSLYGLMNGSEVKLYFPMRGVSIRLTVKVLALGLLSTYLTKKRILETTLKVSEQLCFPPCMCLHHSSFVLTKSKLRLLIADL